MPSTAWGRASASTGAPDLRAARAAGAPSVRPVETTPGARADLLRLAEAMARAQRALATADEAGVWRGPTATAFHARIERQAVAVARLARVAEGAAPLVLAHLRDVDAATLGALTTGGPGGPR